MLIRRMFSRKNSDKANTTVHINKNNNKSFYRKMRRGSVSSEEKPSATFIQLTPLWEHIIRTKTLPANIDQNEMFIEFGERLRDPEWQVRQHALKVLVDVLIVMKSHSDQYFQPLIQPLVENLGHSAPAIRKGSLDVLKVYMSETSKPESTITDIIGLGLHQKKCFEEFDSRVCVGVMLSLPSIIYTSLGTMKHDFIVRAAIEALSKKMIQASYQEIALKVLLRIREMIGVREFSAHIAHGAYRDFELLCNVYGLPATPDKQTDPSIELYRPQMPNESLCVWTPNHSSNDTKSKIVRTELGWDHKDTETSADEDNINTSGGNYIAATGKESRSQSSTSCDKDRFILETEIKVEDTAMTMRIFETNCNSSGNEAPSEFSEDDRAAEFQHNGFIRILTDSELDESNDAPKGSEVSRATAKRVTFGGEIVKMRTPDSDSVLQSDTDDTQKRLPQPPQMDGSQIFLIVNPNEKQKSITENNSSNLLVVGRPQTASLLMSTHTADNHKMNERARYKSASPTGRPRRFSYSSDEPIVSPKAPHKGIEVLHNLQKRSPSVSPSRTKHNSHAANQMNEPQNHLHPDKESEQIASNEERRESMAEINIRNIESDLKGDTNSNKSWMDLCLVDDICLRNVHSEDWRLRSNAMCTIEEMLKSSENLLAIQPHLDSLLHTLLSAEKHPDVLEDKRRILINLISRLPLDNLESHTTQIIFGLCRQGGPGSNCVAKALMQRLPPTSIVLKLISDDVLKARSSRFRENALQIVLFALMTFPSTYFDIMSCVEKSAEAAKDKKKRVRQAALDVLAVLGQITSPKTVLDGVQEACKHDNDSQRLLAAVKARLSRKQLPTVTSDGGVQYALRILTPPQINHNFFGADIDWITAGLGSVSPVAPKKRFKMSEQNVNFRPNESFRGPHDLRSSMKDLSSYRNFSSSSEGDYEHYNLMANDEKSGLAITKIMPSAQRVHPIGYGSTYQRTNLQSQSFPDLTGRSDVNFQRNIKPKTESFRITNRISKLPVASRFPSMEANIEARLVRNDSMIRSTGPIQDNFYVNNHFQQNYHLDSPDDLNNQKISDESRPSTYPTYPEESKIPLPKRFKNVRKYLDTAEGNAIDKMENDIRYFERFKSTLHDNDDANIDEVDYIVKLNHNKPDFRSNIESPFHETFAEQNHNESPFMQKADDIFSENSNAMRRPESQLSIATTKSLKTITDDIDLSERSQLKTRLSHEPSSIEENITAKSEATSMENIDNLSAVDSETFDTSLEHIQNENNEKILAVDSNPIDRPELLVGSFDENEIGTEKSEDTIVEKQPSETLLEAPYANNKVDNETDDNYANSDSESRNSSSRDDSSDFPPVRSNPTIKPNTAPVINKLHTEKPTIHGRFLKRNKISPAKTCPSSATSNVIKSSELYPSSARQIERPRDVAANCLNQLDTSNDWTTVMSGLQKFVQLIRKYPDLVEANIHAYCVALSKQVKNLRSQVSRLACQASAEFFQTHGKHLELESEELVTQLFNRSADTNKFLRADAFRALAAMCDNLSAFKVIQLTLTRGATHQNSAVRTTTANLCSRIVGRLGCEKIFAMNREFRDKLILAGANFLMEGSLDTRNNAKALFKQLSVHPQYNRTLLEVIPPQTYRNIEKALRSIK